MPDKWAQFAQPAAPTGGADKWAAFAAQPSAPASPASTVQPPAPNFWQGLQNYVEHPEQRGAGQPNMANQMVGGVINTVGQVAQHPLDTITHMIASTARNTTALGTLDPQTTFNENPVVSTYHDAKQNGIPAALGHLLAGTAAGTALGIPIEAVATGVAPAVRTAAVGDTDAALLKGLQLGPKSPKALTTLDAAHTAAPFLQGAQDLADLQGRISPAKAAIWKPYQDAVNAIGDRPVNGT